jgi:HPt (histidine-containing phosphotransfer) domain-containing protein
MANAPSTGAMKAEACPAAVERVSVPPESALLAVELSLARIQGDRNLYHQLLVIFVQTYADAADRLRAALPARCTEAYRIVHSLKGAAATVGAEQVVIAAAQLETALRAGELPLPGFLRELERTLHAALRAAEQLIASSPR